MIEFVWARDRREHELLMTAAYHTGLFAQADLKKLPPLKALIGREPPKPQSEQRAEAQRRINEMWGV